MKKRNLAGALTFGAFMAAAATAQAATVTICENAAKPAGYLMVQKDIANGSCPTKKAIKYSTPSEGLTIIKPVELQGFTPPYAVTSFTESPPAYKIYSIKDGLVACSTPPLTPYNFFKKPAGKVGGCAATGPTVDNAVKWFQVMFTEIARPAGQPGQVRVTLNSNYVGAGLNYAITTTSNLNGGSSSVMKTGYTATGSYTLQQLAPQFVTDAQQGATFSFTIEAFIGIDSTSKYTINATGQEMLSN